jgi:hypothetical protein
MRKDRENPLTNTIAVVGAPCALEPFGVCGHSPPKPRAAGLRRIAYRSRGPRGISCAGMGQPLARGEPNAP